MSSVLEGRVCVRVYVDKENEKTKALVLLMDQVVVARWRRIQFTRTTLLTTGLLVGRKQFSLHAHAKKPSASLRAVTR